MFAKFAILANTKVRVPAATLNNTIDFLECVSLEGFRLSYSALTLAAVELGDIAANGQKIGQRGAKLLRGLPVALQPFVCRKNGSYAVGTKWEGVDVPQDLRNRPVISEESVVEAVQTWIGTTYGEESGED